LSLSLSSTRLGFERGIILVRLFDHFAFLLVSRSPIC
jgi:hypothetical protein